MITKHKISKVLFAGENVYINASGNIIPSRCTAITEDGIETEQDFYSYDEHRTMWWLTKLTAK